MKPLRTVVLISFLCILLSNIIIGQDSKNRWYLIQDVEDRIVYIDTSNIELTDTRLFTRNIILYRNPIFMHTQQDYVKKIKSHLLMDIDENTYSVIGAIFYNVDDKVIGESADIISSGGSSSFSLKIQPNSVYELILDKSIEYINTGRITVDAGDYVRKKSKEILAKIPDKVEPVIKEDTLIVTTEIVDTIESVAIINVQPPANEPIEPTPTKIETETPPNELTYDASKDKVASGLIFTDGILFCIQVSSWKTKAIAEKEVNKLINKGHNAFIVSAFIPSKNATWHRVRVGNFTSVNEAKAYQEMI